MVKIRGGSLFEQVTDQLIENASKKAVVDIGFMGDATERKSGINTALVAIFNEYGVPSHKQPPRPFFRGMIDKQKKNWPGQISKLLKDNDYDVHKTMDLMGEEIAGQLHDAIIDYKGPLLAPSTVARKGFDKQLVDTGDMLNSIRHVMKGEGE